MAATVAVMDELLEEILLRFPPDDPARLLHAALVCKRWCHLIADLAFSRRFREFHRAPPALGFLGNIIGINCPGTARFFPTSSFRPPRADHLGWFPQHSAHGRVLFFKGPWGDDPLKNVFLVWDPITDEQRQLPTLSWCPYPFTSSWNAAVLCAAAAGCNHLDCHRGPFLVLFVGTFLGETRASVYSSEADAWSEPTSTQHLPDDEIHLGTKTQALVGNALYFKYETDKLLKYEFTTREMSAIDLPAGSSGRPIVLMAVEEGRLGFATALDSRLYVWSREVGPGGDARWTQSRVIDLDMHLTTVGGLSIEPRVVGCADAAGVIFVRTGAGFFTVDLKSGRIKEVEGGRGYGYVIPFASFCTPALGAACIGERSGAGVSTACKIPVRGARSSK